MLHNHFSTPIYCKHFTRFESESMQKEIGSIIDELDFDKICLITFTSGSTSTPKGVMHSLNNLIYSALSFRKNFQFNNTKIFLHNLSTIKF